MSTIGGTTVTSGIVFGTTASIGVVTSPLTVTSTGAVKASSGDAIYGDNTRAWTVVNSGTVEATGADGDGIDLRAGGRVTNMGTGLIQGYSAGVRVSGSDGTVTNSGTIIGGQGNAYNAFGVMFDAGGTVINDAGLIHGNAYGVAISFYGSTGTGAGIVSNSATITGVYLGAGGSVGNAAAGLISGNGIVVQGAAGTVANSGTIAGVRLAQGGSVDNTGTALIAGYNGVRITGTAGGVANSATIVASTAYAGGTGVKIDGALGSVGNSGTIAGGSGIYLSGGGATVINSGTIIGTLGDGVGIASGGSVANNGGLIAGRSGVVMYSGYTNVTVGLVNNTGTISGTTNSGVVLRISGTVDNAAVSAVIAGATTGVYVSGAAAGTVSNAGTIVGTSGAGVALHLGGSIGNSGRIEGAQGVAVFGAAGTVTNAGTIAGTTGSGVRLNAGGSVDNTATAGVITGARGVACYAVAGTVTNAGTIVGTSGVGVYLYGGTLVNSGTIIGAAGPAISIFEGLVILQAGYQLTGGIYGSSAGTETVELAGTVGAAVTASYNGLALTFFENVLFGPGGYSTLLVSSTGTLGVTISGFDAATEIIDLTGIGGNGTITNRNTATDRITVSGSLGNVTLQFDSIAGVNFTTASNGSGGTELIPVCYCRGTLILTDRGEVAIEALAIGDRVVTAAGAARPVKWIGRRGYDGRFVAGNRKVLPVRIKAGALADGVPARDLRVSPGHALYIDGVLIPAEHLVNGATIVQEEAVEIVEYFHIELETHDILIANGAPTESYVDCDNRGRFHNAAEFARLYPDDERPRGQYCAPVLDWDAPELNRVRARLMGRAGPLGHFLDLDPDLHLVVDGTVIPPTSVDGRRYRFAVPAGAGAVALASRAVVPAEVKADARDRRRLGVPLARLVLFDDQLFIQAEHGHPGLRDGFHDDEATHRWTNGKAHLPARWVRSFPGEFTIEVRLIPSDLPYRLPAAAPAASATRAAA